MVFSNLESLGGARAAGGETLKEEREGTRKSGKVGRNRKKLEVG